MTILAATDFSMRSLRALRQAGLTARLKGVSLCIVHVVDDDRPDRFVHTERREAEQTLGELTSAMAELNGVECRPMVVVGDPFDGILRAAKETNAEFIVMGSHRKQLLRDIFTGTTIERVIRTGTFPVLMVNNEAQHYYKKIIAAIDLSEPSTHALRAADAAALTRNASMTLLHAFVPFGKGKMVAAGMKSESIDDYVAAESQRVADELMTYLDSNNFARRGWRPRIEEGNAFEVICRTVEEERADLLVVGTRSRSGPLKTLIGSVAEEALRSLNVDIFVAPLAGK